MAEGWGEGDGPTQLVDRDLLRRHGARKGGREEGRKGGKGKGYVRWGRNKGRTGRLGQGVGTRKANAYAN